MYFCNSSDLGFATENDLEQHFLAASVTDLNLAGVVFTNNFGSPAGLPDEVNYKLRFGASQLNGGSGFSSLTAATDWLTEFMFPRFQRPEPRNRNSKTGGSPGIIMS